MNLELLRTRDALVAKRDAYNSAITAINELIRVEDGSAVPFAPSAVPSKKRLKAPNGALPTAMLEVITKPMTNPEIRAALAKAEYPYSTGPELIRFHAQKLVTAKKLAADGDGSKTTYRPKQ